MRTALTSCPRRIVEVLIVVSFLFLCYAAVAQQIARSEIVSFNKDSSQAPTGYDASLFSSLRWRNLGPDRGGRSIASAGVVKRPLEYYFGAVGGGLWKTTDGGTNWTPVTDGQIHSSSVGAVAVSESNPDIVYSGMGEACLRSNIMQGDGVYKSVDAGRSWQQMDFSAVR